VGVACNLVAQWPSGLVAGPPSSLSLPSPAPAYPAVVPTHTAFCSQAPRVDR
jgi:hypothetical protein